MIIRGQKRKLPLELSDESALTWESLREFVFSISMSKYQHGQELPEPSLRRSVLIANTLRQMSLDGAPPSYSDRREGDVSGDQPPLEVGDRGGGSAPPRRPQFAPEGASSGMSMLHFGTDAVPSTQEEGEDWESMSADPDFSLSAAISSILSALDSTIDGSPQAVARTPLRSLENLSWSSEGGSLSGKQGLRGNGRCWEQQEECRPRDGGVEAMRSCYLGDLTVEDLFQDIDTSLLERDMGILGLRGGGAGQQQGEDLLWYLPPFPSTSSPVQPLSLSFNQNVRCLPSFSSFSPSSFPASPHPLSSAPSPPFAAQGMRDSPELDHLMEILVES